MSKTKLFLLTKLINRHISQSLRPSFSTYKCLLNVNRDNNCDNSSKILEHDDQEVLDIYKERLKYSSILEEEKEYDKYSGLNLNHGVFGVYDIEDLVETLHAQNALDIFVASVPKEIKYVDYIVLVTGRSQRHMQAIAQFVRRIYKHKRHSTDMVPKLEGENSPDWMALDLGNIALHIFSRKSRAVYDLDSLWALGPKYDEECNKKEPISNMLEQHAIFLESLQQAS